jgi:hypothetical protein
MKTKKKRDRSAPRKDLYRCPGCGRMVDNTDLSAMLEHHQHVLRARVDTFVTLPVVTIPAR